MESKNGSHARKPKGANRMTRQRAVIMRELCALKTHPTADEIYHIVRSTLPHISLGTVYRNLEHLAENGEILKLECAGNQKRFDGNTMPHHHIRCEKCGRVCDVMSEIPLPQVDEKLKESLSAQGFVLTSLGLSMSGICKDCAS